MAGVVAAIVALGIGAAAWFGGLKLGWSVGLGLGVFLSGVVFIHFEHLRKVNKEIERLIGAGDFTAARRLGERKEKVLSKDLRFAQLLELARTGEAGTPEPAPEPPPEPEAEVAPERPPAPTEPVASRLTVPVIALLIPALVPALGLLAAPVLLVLSLLLLRKRDPLAWDRRIAAVGVATAALSLLASAAGVWGVLSGGGSEDAFPDLELSQTTRMQVLQIVVLVLSVVAHEVSHGLAALISGDPTAGEKGRLSPNPIRHIDPFGSVVLPVVLSLIPGGIAFGWAKPVPVDRRRFRRPRAGDAFVSVAGVATNVLLALSCAALLLLTALAITLLCPGRSLPELAQPLAAVNAPWLPGGVVMEVWIELLKAGILINLILASLNLLPIPPLDGSHLVRSILPEKAAGAFGKLGVIGLPLLIVLVMTDAIVYAFMPGFLVGLLLTMLPVMIFPL